MELENMETGITCSNCKAPVLYRQIHTIDFFQCNKCHHKIYLETFPSLYQSNNEGNIEIEASIESGSSCFYHKNRNAVIICHHCGRFACTLCNVEINDLNLCSMCFDIKRKKGEIENLEKKLTLYDTKALYLSLIPILGPPYSLYYCIRYWNEQVSIFPRTKIRWILAGIISSLQMIFIIFFILDNFL